MNKIKYIINIAIMVMIGVTLMADEGMVYVSGIDIVGTRLITLREQGDIIDKYLGQEVSDEVLGCIEDEVNGLLIEKGYVTTKAYVDEGSYETGVITVEVEEGVVERVEYDRGKRMTAFPQVEEGQVLNVYDLNQGIDQIGRMGSRKAAVALWPGEREGSTVVKVSEMQGDVFRWYVGGDNQGSEEKGRYRAKNIIESDNLFGFNDALRLTFTGNDREQGLGWNVSVPWGYWTLGYEGSYGPYEYDIKGFSDSEMKGYNFSQTVTLGRLLYRGEEHKLSVEGSFNVQSPERSLDGHRLGSQELRIIGIKLKDEFNRGKLRGEWYGEYKKGVGFLGASVDDDGIGKEATHAQFDKVELGADMVYSLKKWLDLRSQWVLQYGWCGLPSSEQLSLSSFQEGVRGFGALGVSQNTGICSRNDLVFKIAPMGALQVSPYIFLDYGLGWEWGTRWDMASAGGGLKFTLFDRLSGDVNFAKGFYVGGGKGNLYRGGFMWDAPVQVNVNLLLKVF